MMDVFLELPTMKRKEEALKFIDEFIIHESKINGTGGLDSSETYEIWLENTLYSHNGGQRPNRVSASTYFLIDKDTDEILGMINIRHKLNDYLITNGYGHIGYSIRPSKRRKGYATKLLELGLDVCKERNISEVMIGCYKDNIGSKKTIENNGGKLIKEFRDSDGLDNLVYMIYL